MHPFDVPIVDDFTQADGAIDGRVASSGYVWESPFVATHVAGQIASNGFQGAAAQDRDAVLQGVWPSNIIAAARIAVVGSAMYIITRIQETSFPVAAASRHYYIGRITVVGSTNDDTCAIQRNIDGTVTTLATFNLNADWAVGDIFAYALEETGSSTKYTAMRIPSGGDLVVLGTGVDSVSTRPTGPGAVALEIDSTGGALDDLRIGALVPPFRPSIHSLSSLSSP